MNEILNLIYVSNIRLHGMQIPTRVQVKFARDYCKKKELDFSLPVSESWTSNKFELLQNIITKPFKHLILFSDFLICSPYVLMVIENNLPSLSIGEALPPAFESKPFLLKIILFILYKMHSRKNKNYYFP